MLHEYYFQYFKTVWTDFYNTFRVTLTHNFVSRDIKFYVVLNAFLELCFLLHSGSFVQVLDGFMIQSIPCRTNLSFWSLSIKLWSNFCNFVAMVFILYSNHVWTRKLMILRLWEEIVWKNLVFYSSFRIKLRNMCQ